MFFLLVKNHQNLFSSFNCTGKEFLKRNYKIWIEKLIVSHFCLLLHIVHPHRVSVLFKMHSDG